MSRRNPVPKPPLPTAGNGNGTASVSTNPPPPPPPPPTTSLHAGAKAFIPSSASKPNNTNTNNNGSNSTTSPNPMQKMLSATAVSFQPKFSNSNNNSPNSVNAPDPSTSAIKNATATIPSAHAAEVAKSSKMRATAEGFTPTRSNEGSFPTSPEKNTNNNNLNGKKPPPPPTSANGSANPTPASLNNKNNTSTIDANKKQQQSGEQQKETTTTTTAAAAANATAALQSSSTATPAAPLDDQQYADPFKNSKLALSGEDKEYHGTMETAAPRETMHLNSSWTLYVLDQSQRFGPVIGASVSQQQQLQQAQAEPTGPEKLYTVQDVEGFWRLLRSIPLPSTRTPKFTYYFFRKSIYPSWEEPRNKNGGTFQFVVWDQPARGASTTDKETANDVWHLVLMGLMGESLAEANIINGACLKIRKSTTIEFWTNVSNQRQVVAFMASVKELISKRVSSFPMRNLDNLEYTSNVTNIAKSHPAPPAGASTTSAVATSSSSSPTSSGAKNNKNHAAVSQPVVGTDFKI